LTAVTVIIPALNEAGNIRQLVEEVCATARVNVIVVDNGSTDSTSQEALEAGAKVVSEPRRGYGYACAAGVAEAGNADVLVFLDGDHSFAPSDLPSLLTPINEGRADMVLGSRTLGYIEPGAMLLRKLGATFELWGHFRGVINTKEKFEAHRYELAKRVWTRMKKTDSLECRNCHKDAAMSAELQSEKAQNRHAKGKAEGLTCIDCHYAIAHDEPDGPGPQEIWKSEKTNAGNSEIENSKR